MLRVVGAQASIRRRGGLAATHELHDDGYGRAAISAALRAGAMVRVRQGWYAEPGRHPDVIRAARVGGRATCSTALSLLGFWVVGDRHLHVSVRPDATQLRHSRDKTRRLVTDPSKIRVHWRESGAMQESRLIVPPMQALRDYAQCAPADLVGAAAESMAHADRSWLDAIHRFGEERRGRLRRVLSHVDGLSESGTEFLMRWRLSGRLGLSVVPQVSIAGVGRVDLVIGRRLVVEVDSEAYHTDPARYEDDRRRDAALGIRGFRVLRFSYRQVMSEWATVQAAVQAAVARGDTW